MPARATSSSAGRRLRARASISPTLDGSNGFQLERRWRRSTTAAARSPSAGDVNGDGIDDLIVGAPAPIRTATTAGASYVVFGTAAGFAAEPRSRRRSTAPTASASTATAPYDDSGRSVPSAGDVNGDGFDDLIIGASAPIRRQLCRRELCGVRQGRGFAPTIDLVDARRQQRLQPRAAAAATTAASPSPRRATSTATASTT